DLLRSEHRGTLTSRRFASPDIYTASAAASSIGGIITNSVFRLAARRTELCAKAPQLETAPVSEKRTNSVFRLAARRTELCAKAPQLETAPVSEKRVGLSRCPRRPGYGRLTALDRLAVRAIGGFRSAGWHLLGHPPGFRVVSGGCA